MEPTLTTDLTTTKNSPATFNVKPSLAHTKKLVSELMAYVDDNKLAVNIAGKKYLQVEAWQFTGSQLNLTAVVTEIEDITPEDGKAKYKATVEVIHNPTGQLVSRGFALCSKTETKKSSFDEYAVASMAQTRAIGKAYRNILAWLPKMAGYEGTPAEEISDNARDTMAQELAEKKAEVFAEFTARDVTDNKEMVSTIKAVTGFVTIKTVDDAQRVLDYLRKDDNEAK